MGFMDSVKGFAGKVGDSVERGAKSVSDSSKKMQEKSRIKKEISNLEAEVNAAYFAIGKKYFELNSNTPGEDYAESVDTIIKSTDRLEKFKLLLASLDDKMLCSGCGAEVTRNQKFCDKCGAKVEFPETPIIEGYNDAPAAVVSQPEVAPQPVASFCASCGAQLEPGQKFCDKCGAKV
ncbi:MAG: zinc ribbon domain-containing protein [Ruminococcus sp.]|nr:zinc ribbon domain-containing protein [Ruminococcus sp.]